MEHNKEKQIEEMAEDICEGRLLKESSCGECWQRNASCLYLEIATDLTAKGYRKASEVARKFRQRMNEKMGKHTHLLGKEYVQRIMREIEMEFSEVENG